MRFIRSFLLLGAAILFAMSAHAQYRWGPTVGFNFSDYHMNQKLVSVTGTPGFSAGVMGEIIFPGIGFGADAAVLYNMHGAHFNLGEHKVWQSEGYGKELVTVHSLQIPVNLKFKYTNLKGLERVVAPFAYAGPVVSFTLAHSGQKAFEYPAGSIQLHCGLGAELFEHWQVSIGYYWGLSYEIRTVRLDNFSGRPRGWDLKLSYLF